MHDTPIDQEIAASLSPVERKLVNYFQDIERTGHYNTRVTLFLTSQTVEDIRTPFHPQERLKLDN